jgi:anthranilate synthase/aminodeoxychorismate synthase-like glutamine amidotransferase
MILLLDNYDSFVHNLARYFQRLGQATLVVRNDAIDVAGIHRMKPEAIVISPGPCTPAQAGCSLDVVRQLTADIPTLGVCLGHQAIAAALGGSVVRAHEPVHGQASLVRHCGAGLFEGLPNPLQVGRYHSLLIDQATLPHDIEVTAATEDGVIMAIAHARRPLVGVQFHPESILTECGYELLANFLRLARIPRPPSIPSGESERPAPPLPFQPPARPPTF